MLIDVHTHIVPEALPDFARRAGGERWPRMDRVDACTANVMISGRNFRTVTDQCWSVPRRLSDMEGEGVGRQVLSPMPRLFSYWAAPDEARDFCRYVNETLAAMVQAAPERFYGLGIVPMQHPELAAQELDGLRKLGLHGLEIGTNIDGRSLGDPRFLPFFQELERQGLPLFVHAQDPTDAGRFSGAPVLGNLIGFPQENVLAAATLITGGVIERCPRLKVLFSHGGGGFAMMLPRLDQGWRTMGQYLPRLPSEYARNFYFDTLLYDAGAVRYLIERFGPQRVTVGSDYPFVIREVPPGRHLQGVAGLSQADRERIHSRTALEFLGIHGA
jgi:aminocarboxymuconate-semialdehyde decarboxylase